MGFYHYPCILRTGEICNVGCYHREGCKVHWDSPKRIPSKECGKLTSSTIGACKDDSGKYCFRDHYQREKLIKLAQNEFRIKESPSN
ncbi:5998_t:CDS:2 [Entrophospora sp. SA101]|nr:5998_t:CDS:2 [Entrophospora sp. SA101]